MTGDPDTRPDTDPHWVVDEDSDHTTVLLSYEPEMQVLIAPAGLHGTRADYFMRHDAFADLVKVVRDAESLPTCRGIVALLLDGQTPQPDGHWYATDENGDPHYLNDPITPEQKAELDAIRQTNGVGE